MSLGSRLRTLLGPRLARRVGRAYRAIFVDLECQARSLSSVLPTGAHVLDVGGGDGEPLNYLLDLRTDLRVSSIDPSDAIGQWIEVRHADRVTCLAGMTLEAYLGSGCPDPDAVLIADVLHHILPAQREQFMASLGKLIERRPATRIVVKDVEPGTLRSLLGYWSDRYVTGDRQVSLVSRAELLRLFESLPGKLSHQEAPLYAEDSPNYVMVFYR